MAKQLFANNVALFINGPVAPGDTLISALGLVGLANPTNGDYYVATLAGVTALEIVRITAVAGDILTVVRGQEGTTPQFANTNATLTIRVTAGGLNNLRDYNSTYAGTVAQTVDDKLMQTVSVQDFGVLGDGVTDNTVALAAFRDWIAAKLAAGNCYKVVWPAGRYLYTQGPNWAISGLVMEAAGEVWLIHTGSGLASFTMDGSAIGGGVRGLKLTGDFRVYPNANSAQGVVFSYIHASDIQITSRGAGTGFQAIFITSCVCTLFRIRASSNDGGWYNTPTHALYVTQTAPGDQTSYCTFLNPVLEGSPYACYMDGTLGNTFIGGTMEAASNTGLHLTSNAIQNKFIGIDMEVNTNYDIRCEGNDNEFIACDTYSKFSIAGGSNNRITGGTHELVEVVTPATRTLLSSFKYNRFSGTAYPPNSGTFTRWRDLTNAQTGEQHNAPPTAVQLTVGASPYTYTNTTGNDQGIYIQPGTVSAISVTRGANTFSLPLTSGLYELSPYDALVVTYSVIPAIFVLNR